MYGSDSDTSCNMFGNGIDPYYNMYGSDSSDTSCNMFGSGMDPYYNIYGRNKYNQTAVRETLLLCCNNVGGTIYTCRYVFYCHGESMVL